MSTRPPQRVVNAIESGVAEVTRRVAVFESDGVTLWNPDSQDDPNFNRLVDGQVTVDFNSDERRKLDITLNNKDGLLRLNPRGGFYYDKVIKVFRGVRFRSEGNGLRVAIIDFEWNLAGLDLNTFMNYFKAWGHEVVDMTASTDLADFMDFDVIVSITRSRAQTVGATNLLKELFAIGKNIITYGVQNDGSHVPHIATQAASGSQTWSASYYASDHPFKGLTDVPVGGAVTGTGPLTLTAWGVPVAGYPDNNPANPAKRITASLGTNLRNSLWLDVHLSTCTVEAQAMLKRYLEFTGNRGGLNQNWEFQLGEFLIDNANDQIFPNQIKLTLRDNTKKLLKDKISQTSTFVKGTLLRDFVRAIASNGGIKKFRLSIGDEVLVSDMSYDRGTERWQIIKDACESFNYEVFFDNEGYLVARQYLDPSTSPVEHVFQTGKEGNLITFDRSMNDSRIYNIINVYGDPADGGEARLPYFGTARNEDPNSPTSTVRLGNRVYTFASTFFTSDAQCRELALARLAVLALESYEVNFSSLVYPWLEVGEIVEILDPNAIATDPTRFLMDTLTIPLGLSPMTGTGKRVTYVGSAGALQDTP